MKVCVIDEGGSLIPLTAHISPCTLLLTWRKMLKNDYNQWVLPGHAEQPNKLQKTLFAFLCSGGRVQA